jgi:hypothetical protein
MRWPHQLGWDCLATAQEKEIPEYHDEQLSTSAWIRVQSRRQESRIATAKSEDDAVRSRARQRGVRSRGRSWTAHLHADAARAPSAGSDRARRRPASDPGPRRRDARRTVRAGPAMATEAIATAQHASVQEIARVVACAGSPRTSYVTGAIIIANGGRTAAVDRTGQSRVAGDGRHLRAHATR